MIFNTNSICSHHCTGFGGKLEPGETIEQAAIRELEEESKIVAKSLKRVGFLNFVMCSKIMKVHVYTCVDFQGYVKMG